MTDFTTSGKTKALMLGAFALLCTSAPAPAARVSNPVASFSGLDKITGRITTFDAYVGETVQFGALQVTPKACYNRDESEAQRVDAFVEVDEITLDRKIRRIFNGWMFADSPALNAIEHPIFDVWLKECKQKSDVPPPKDLKIPPSEPKAPPKPKDAAPQAASPEAPVPAAPLPDGQSVEPPSDQTLQPPADQTLQPPADQTLQPPAEEALPPLEDGTQPLPADPEFNQPLPDNQQGLNPDPGFGQAPDPGLDQGFGEPDGSFPPAPDAPASPQSGQGGGGFQ